MQMGETEFFKFDLLITNHAESRESREISLRLTDASLSKMCDEDCFSYFHFFFEKKKNES